MAIYPVLPASSKLVATPGAASRLSAHATSAQHELAQRMKVFKVYLEGRGAALAHSAECLPFYALPYVPQARHGWACGLGADPCAPLACARGAALTPHCASRQPGR
jgi:hypothetical protein